MRYWLAQLIYFIRRSIPLYANDNSKIYTAYSAHILKRLSAPHLSSAQRCKKFLHFSEHFIEDISGERLADTLIKLGEPKNWIEEFDQHIRITSNPRASILLRRTKAALTHKHNLNFVVAPLIDFNWSEISEEQFNTARLAPTHLTSSLLDYMYWPYRIWRFFFRFKNTSLFGQALRGHFLRHLSSDKISDDVWLKNFEKYATLFKSPADIFIMAENLKLRNPARDLALLEFTYRVSKKKPKVTLFFRRVRLVLASIIHGTLPEYRGTELTKLFFNPVEIERQKQQEKIKTTAKIKAEKRAQNRKKLTEKSLKRGNKIIKARTKKTAKQKLRAQKNTPNIITTLNLPLTLTFRRLFNKTEMVAYNPVQLITKSPQNDPQFQYTSVNRKFMRSDPSLAIISMTGRFDPYLDMSLLVNYSKLIILNSTALKNADLKKNLQDYIGSHVEIECFSPSRRLIKPYTQDHKTVSDFSDRLAGRLIDSAFENSAISKYLKSDLSEDYKLLLSDNMFRSIERLYAAHLFFETIAKTTPVFFNSPRDNFQFTLARLGFSKIVILGGGKRLGEMRDWNPKHAPLHPRRWLPRLRKSFEEIDKNIRGIISGTVTDKNNGVIIATHSRSSIHKLCAQKIYECFSEDCDIQTIDFAPAAPLSDEGHNFYSVTTKIDPKLKSEIRLAILPLISETLSELALSKYDTTDLTPEIASVIARNAGLILGQTSLFDAVRHEYAKHNKSTAILVPGRYAEIRAIARAFHTLGFPTVDVQLLFLSTMARYKAPMTSHHAVIDKAAQDFYIKNYDIKKSTIGIMGSIARDEDIIHARDFGREASLTQFGLSDEASVITLACQPGFETITQEAALILSDYIKTHPAVSLCIKLHPAQSSAQRIALEDIFKNNLPDHMSGRWHIIHKDPFWKLMPVTDILISYFSNVCLQACAFNIPVLSLPGGGPRPNPNFEELGLARNVQSLDDLNTHLDNILAIPKAQRIEEPPYSYLQDNPHMADAETLSRLKNYVEALRQEAP